MRGSQRARDILKAMGEEAFQWFNITVGYGPGAKVRKQRPLSGRQIAQLKKECLIRGEYASIAAGCSLTAHAQLHSQMHTPSNVCREWPYEHLAPTAQKPIQHPKKWPKGHKHERLAVERQQNISKNMENMEKWIAESKVLSQPHLFSI